MRSIALLALVPSVLMAQRRDRVCTAPKTGDSLTVVVTAQLTPFDTTITLPDAFTGLLLQELTTRLRLPRPFTLSTYVSPDSIGGEVHQTRRAYPGVFAMFAVKVQSTTIKPALSVSSAVPAFDRAIIDAIKSIETDSAVPPLPEALRRKKLDLRLRIGTAQRAENAAVLFRLRVPLSTLSSEVVPQPVGRGLRYPEELRRENMEGSVLMQFVVDESGAPLEGSLRVVRTDHVLFAQPVLEFVRKMRFVPAKIGDCPVAMLVQQPFNFTLRQ